MVEPEAPKPKKQARGAALNVQQKLARLDILANKVMRFWERTLDEKSQATTAEKIQVSRDVVAYAWGKPKQQVQVDAKVEINHRAHIEALHYLASVASGPVIDAKPLNTIDNQEPVTKSPLLSLPDQTDNPLANLGLAGLDLGELAAPFLVEVADDDQNDPPPGASGTPGGGTGTGQGGPLDIKNDD